MKLGLWSFQLRYEKLVRTKLEFLIFWFSCKHFTYFSYPTEKSTAKVGLIKIKGHQHPTLYFHQWIIPFSRRFFSRILATVLRFSWCFVREILNIKLLEQWLQKNCFLSCSGCLLSMWICMEPITWWWNSQ